MIQLRNLSIARVTKIEVWTLPPSGAIVVVSRAGECSPRDKP